MRSTSEPPAQSQHAPWYDEARALRAQGLLYREIAERLDKSISAVSEAIRGDSRERKRRWDAKPKSVCGRCGGERTSPEPGLCRDCQRDALGERRDARRQKIADLWNDGATLLGIATALDSTANAIGVEMARMRSEGWELEVRRPDLAAFWKKARAA